ncbi:leucine--tRNA ligase [Ekhidna sp.]|uniref:leucine--tRNA ligase n=1 Tax=Ekhidna sp. TaxID=2608089 RepID=UPI003B59665A
MAEYNFQEIEKKWQQYWSDQKIYGVQNESDKPKYYILDMFPYPSGAGLHVGHPLGYIASDIVGRYKRLKGYNVLHPMGFDSFGLPAEQYAIQTGQHPAVTTEQNINRYKEQLKALGFSYDWSREVRTSDPTFYKWTQWIFKLIYNSWYDKAEDKARHVDDLISVLEKEGNKNINAACDADTPTISADEWNGYSEKEQQLFLLKYRLTYQAETTVNWCPALGTVLSNDEVKDGFSERGGHPVVKKKMPQWSMRITAYADRLLSGLDKIDWPEPIKEMQRNWIGKSYGAEIDFEVLTPNPSPMERGKLEAWKTANPKKAKILKEFARENRKNPTSQEDALWQVLRNKKTGFKVRRQHAIEDFIVDFLFLREKLIIEVDGGYHNESEQREFDQAKRDFLTSLGYQILVYKNEEVDLDITNVVNSIKHKLEEITKSPPSPSGKGSGDGAKIRVFTTRIDTIFGVTFMVLAPESELALELTTHDQKKEVEEYVEAAKNRSERERLSDTKHVSGVFTGSYAIHPFSGEKIPVYIADYVLAGYGTGAVMAVPSGDQRDFDFAKKYDLPIPIINDAQKLTETEADPTKEGKIINSYFLNGLSPEEAMERGIQEVEKRGIGVRKVNYKLRDAIFGRQRYWGEPIPVYYEDGIPKLVPDEDLPLDLPKVDEYLPTEDGDPPLGRAKDWNYNGHPYELSTMPGWAGSSWYFFRYMDPDNKEEFCSKEAMKYWQDVDFYLGGSEHATGHLLYSRFWTKFLYDMGIIEVDEYAKKLVNQGMIQGRSNFVYRINPIVSYHGEEETSEISKKIPPVFVSEGLVTAMDDSLQAKLDEVKKDIKNQLKNDGININYKADKLFISKLHVDISLVENDILNTDQFIKSTPDYKDSRFILEDGKYHCGWEVEKMSKSKFNVVNPDELVERYGADTLRMYEMFLGPIEQSKPWNTNGIEGVYKFLRKFWSLFHDGDSFKVTDDEPTKDELKVLHGTIRKIAEDAERLSLNTSVSTFMIATNELSSLKCNKRAILEPMTIILSPFAPHIAEELWHLLGNEGSVVDASYPAFEEKYLVEDSIEYPVSVNGKMRAKISFPAEASKEEIEAGALGNETIQKWMEGKDPRKVIVVPKKIVNIVV